MLTNISIKEVLHFATTLIVGVVFILRMESKIDVLQTEIGYLKTNIEKLERRLEFTNVDK